MISKVIGLAVLGKIYTMLKNNWSDSPLFKAGIIDKDGNQIVDKKDFTSDQSNAWTHINVFGYKLKKILVKNPALKLSLLSAAASAIFLKESEQAFPFVMYQGEPVFYLGNGEIVTEDGPKFVNESEILDLFEENSVAGVAMYDKPIDVKKKNKKCKDGNCGTDTIKRDTLSKSK